jgi:hypothetical protein
VDQVTEGGCRSVGLLPQETIAGRPTHVLRIGGGTCGAPATAAPASYRMFDTFDGKQLRGTSGYGFQTIDPIEHPGERREIGLYPWRGVARVTPPDVSFEVGNAKVGAAEEGIRVDTENGNARVPFLRDGHVALGVSRSPRWHCQWIP